MDSVASYESDIDNKGQDKYAEETISEWFKSEIEKYKRIQQKNDRECTETRRRVQATYLNWEAQIDVLTKKCREEGTKEVSRSSVSECRAIYANNDCPIDNTLSDETNKLHEVSFIANVEDDKGKVLPCQIPPKELNPGSFTLPCTIRNLNFYAMADLGASVNVIPKSIFEFLKLTHLKKTNMLVEMADMIKRVPIGIVQNVPVKIKKFLFPSNFVVIDMLEAQTMILGRPFLVTINAEINVFNKEILLGIGEDRITFNMDKKIHNFTTPIEKAHVINSIQDGESCISRAYNQHKSTQDNDDIQGRCGKKARIDYTDPIIPKVHICRPVKQDCDQNMANLRPHQKGVQWGRRYLWN
ncbi:reverse transcriptase domain-containing protein [Tanacetum coccineum]